MKKIRKQVANKTKIIVPLLVLSLSFLFIFSLSTVSAENNDTNYVNNSSTTSGVSDGYSNYKLVINKINGQKAGDYWWDTSNIKSGDKLKVETIAYHYDEILGWTRLPWVHLNFYLKKYDGAPRGTVWEKDGVVTNLFTGTASVTIDTSNLPPGNYIIEVTYPCEGYADYASDARRIDIYSTGLSEEDENVNNGSNNGTQSANDPKKGTIGMQKTGTPINYLILAVLMVLSGLLVPKRK